jgi:hypothetical protein
MSSYTAQQYRDQRLIMSLINRANTSGVCPVCMRRSQAMWRSGQRRVTCGNIDCYNKWLRVRPEKGAAHETINA